MSKVHVKASRAENTDAYKPEPRHERCVLIRCHEWHRHVHTHEAADHSLRQGGHCNEREDFHHVVQVFVVVLDVVINVLGEFLQGQIYYLS